MKTIRFVKAASALLITSTLFLGACSSENEIGDRGSLPYENEESYVDPATNINTEVETQQQTGTRSGSDIDPMQSGDPNSVSVDAGVDQPTQRSGEVNSNTQAGGNTSGEVNNNPKLKIKTGTDGYNNPMPGNPADTTGNRSK